jgi:hypothetical protein
VCDLHRCRGKEAVKAFIKRSRYRLPAFLGSDEAISKLYCITGVPETFVIGRKGVIISKIVGPRSGTHRRS